MARPKGNGPRGNEGELEVWCMPVDAKTALMAAVNLAYMRKMEHGAGSPRYRKSVQSMLALADYWGLSMYDRVHKLKEFKDA